MKKEGFNKAIRDLNDLRIQDADSWGLFFLGTQIFIGNTRVYTSEARARLRIQDYLGGGHLYGRTQDCLDVITKLEKSGMLEIRRIGDRSEKFPRNRDIDKDLSSKIESMLDAKDDEMVELALTIITQLPSKKL